ncbi:hypothetical protein TpMuguga_01g00342 [Theileria parva strain Muguga]|uniref:Uncharacterized protein n=1 Tax=Theileria parva TaxID=5875 RepID=Q4N8X2_THEPA|nr:uncharacterized protein TpMuguga_01g00342 [Theileria parva strain Muguga]EAN33586.1 hypothetical protein TpMuguga_01g00342 [Theileria parva strain Muguga]|eukprot:XP_765869.1 hypothetical protein [Theileria parva strain Muguga]
MYNSNDILNGEFNIQKCSHLTDKLESNTECNINNCNINRFNPRISVLYDILNNKCKLNKNWNFKVDLISYKSIDDINFLNNLNSFQSYLDTKYKKGKNVVENIDEIGDSNSVTLDDENEEILKYITYYFVEFVCEIERKLKIKNYKQKIVKLLLIIPNIKDYITNYVSDIVVQLPQNTLQIALYYNIYITLSLIIENNLGSLRLNTLSNTIINTYINNRKIHLETDVFESAEDVVDFLCTGGSSNVVVNDGIVSKVDEVVLKCMNVILVNHLYSPETRVLIVKLLKYFYNIIANNVLTNEHTTIVTCNFIYTLELLYDHFHISFYTILCNMSRDNSFKLVKKVNYFNYLYIIKSILIFLSHSIKDLVDNEENLSLSPQLADDWIEILNNCYKIIISEVISDNNKYISNYILLQLIHLYLINVNKVALPYSESRSGDKYQFRKDLGEKLVKLYKLLLENDISDKKILNYLITTIKRIDINFDIGTISVVKESVSLEKVYDYYNKLENGSVKYTILVHNGLKYIMYNTNTNDVIRPKVSLGHVLCKGVPFVSENKIDYKMITSDKLTMMEKLVVNTNDKLINLIPNYINVLIYINQIKTSETVNDSSSIESGVNGDQYKEVYAISKVLNKYDVSKVLENVESPELIQLKDLNFLLTILINNLKNITISTKTRSHCKLKPKLYSIPELSTSLLITGRGTVDEIEVIVNDKYKLDKKTFYYNLYYNNINIVMNIIRFISNHKKFHEVFVLKFLLTHALDNINLCNHNYFIYLINNIISNIITRMALGGGNTKNNKITGSEDNEVSEQSLIREILVLLYNKANNDIVVNILHNFIVKLHENLEARRLVRTQPLFSCLLHKLYTLFKEVSVDDKLLLFNTTLKLQNLIEAIGGERFNDRDHEPDKEHHSVVLLNYIKENITLLNSVNTSKYEVNVYYILLYLNLSGNYNNPRRNRMVNVILFDYLKRTLDVEVRAAIDDIRTDDILETILTIIRHYYEKLNYYINNNVNILAIFNLLYHYIESSDNCGNENEVLVQTYRYLVCIMNKVINKYISYNNNMLFLDCRGYYIENSIERNGDGGKDTGDDEAKLKNYLIYKLMFEVIGLIRILVGKLDVDLHRFNLLVINYIINIRNISIIDKFNNLLSITLNKFVNSSAGVSDYNSVIKVNNTVNEVESGCESEDGVRLDEANKLFKDFINSFIVKHFSNSDVKSSKNGIDGFVKPKITVNCTAENKKLMFYIHYIINILLNNDYINIKVNDTISGDRKGNFDFDFEEFEVAVSEMDINIRCEYISMIFMTIIKTINSKNAGNKVMMINNIISLLLEVINDVNFNVVINILRYIYRCVHSKYINSTTLTNTIHSIKSIYDNSDSRFTINWKLNNSILLLLSTIISCHTLNTNGPISPNSFNDKDVSKLDNHVNGNDSVNKLNIDRDVTDTILRLIKKYKNKYVILFIYYFHQINVILENNKKDNSCAGLSSHETRVVGSVIKYCINNKLLSNDKLYVLVFKYCYRTRHKLLNYLLNDVKDNYNEMIFYVKFHLIQILFPDQVNYDGRCDIPPDSLLIINIILLKLLNDWDIKIRNEVKEKIKKAYIQGNEDEVINEEVYSYEYIILSDLHEYSKTLFYSISEYFISFYNTFIRSKLSSNKGSISDETNDLSVIYEVEDEDDGGLNIIKNILLIIRNKEKNQRLINDLINKLYTYTSCNSLKNTGEVLMNSCGNEDFINEFRVGNIILYALQHIRDDITGEIIINL